MDRKCKTIKLKQLIEELQSLYIDRGNLPVVISRDEEGNGFGTLDTENFCAHCVGLDRGIVAIYPWAEHLELDEIDTEQ